MLALGKYNLLEVLRDTGSGLFLGNKEGDEVLLPGKFIPEAAEVGQYIEVFVYRDNEERLIATTQETKICLYEFATLKVRSVNDYGAFLDYGIDKDLFVPFKEQKSKMIEGHYYMVYMYLDGQTDRLTGSAKIEQFLELEDIELEEGMEVLIQVWNKTDLGYNVIINNQYLGLVYANEIYGKLPITSHQTAFVYKIRENGKIDLRLEKDGYAKVEPNAQKILQCISKHEGFLPLTDKSAPESIKSMLGMSKKTFKKSIGSLYKQKVIKIEKEGIRLLK